MRPDAESHIDEVKELHREKAAKHRVKQNLRTYGRRFVVAAPIPGDKAFALVNVAKTLWRRMQTDDLVLSHIREKAKHGLSSQSALRAAGA